MPDQRPSREPEHAPGAGVRGSVQLHERAEIERVTDLIVGSLTGLGYTKASVFAVRLALEEAVSNAFHHGHRQLPAGTPIRLEYAVDGARVRLVVEDQGPGFSPEAVPDPTLDQNLELPSGRGLMLMRAYMTRVEFNERGNRVTLVYDRPPARNGTRGASAPPGEA